MNTTKLDIQSLMQKEVSRKEFLHIVGAGLLGVVGVTSALQNLSKLAGNNTSANQLNSSRGYGGSPYGR